MVDASFFFWGFAIIWPIIKRSDGLGSFLYQLYQIKIWDDQPIIGCCSTYFSKSAFIIIDPSPSLITSTRARTSSSWSLLTLDYSHQITNRGFNVTTNLGWYFWRSMAFANAGTPEFSRLLFKLVQERSKSKSSSGWNIIHITISRFCECSNVFGKFQKTGSILQIRFWNSVNGCFQTMRNAKEFILIFFFVTHFWTATSWSSGMGFMTCSCGRGRGGQSWFVGSSIAYWSWSGCHWRFNWSRSSHRWSCVNVANIGFHSHSRFGGWFHLNWQKKRTWTGIILLSSLPIHY